MDGRGYIGADTPGKVRSGRVKEGLGRLAGWLAGWVPLSGWLGAALICRAARAGGLCVGFPWYTLAAAVRSLFPDLPSMNFV